MGLHLDDFRTVDDAVVADFVPRSEYAGFDDTLHGGIVAAALDEISAWSAMIHHDVLVFTAKLEIRYRAPAPTDSPITVAATVVERRGRRLSITATAHDDNRLVAESSGLFVVAEDHMDAAGIPDGSTSGERRQG